MKLRKRFAAMCAATVMAVGTLGIEASASASFTFYEYSNYIVCSISGADSSITDSTVTFKAYSSGSHTVTYTVGTSSKAYVRLVPDSGSIIKIDIPKAAPGMPSTLSGSYSLSSTTRYKVRAYTPTSGSYNGSVTINGATLS